MKHKELIETIAKTAANETVSALGIAQQMGMVTNQQELTVLIASGIETALEEFVEQLEKEDSNQIILNETGSIRKDSDSN